jgi:hypothetical protein
VPKANSPESPLADERLATPSFTAQERASRSAEDSSRTDEDGTITTVSERRLSLRDEFMEFALPTPPKSDQWHYFWWSTTAQHDPLQRRIRLGYEIVNSEMLPGFGDFRVKNGQYEGALGVNEMILLRIPQSLYLDYMHQAHHEQPLEEESRLDIQWELAKTAGGKLKDQAIIRNEDAMAETQRTIAKPRFE